MAVEEDDFDMFAVSAVPSSSVTTHSAAPSQSTAAVLVDDHHTDAQGYFHAPAGTVLLPERLQIAGKLGQGVFSTVFLCKRLAKDHNNADNADADNTDEEEVAVKVVRANDTMYKAGRKEIAILEHLAQQQEQIPVVVRLLSWFEMPLSAAAAASSLPHLVLVFERMGMNLRETMDKFGRNVGLSLEGVRVFARQLMCALAMLQRMGLVHADLKPDNIMVSQDFRRCAIGDFGSAFYFATDADAAAPTPYLVSRFYRAPEIILGCPATPAGDVWSLGVLLYELFAGQVLFPGHTNNDMLHRIHQTLGRFPKHMIRRHCQVYADKLELEPHYDPTTMQFKSHETLADGKVVRRMVTVREHGTKPIWSLLVDKAQQQEEDGEEVNEDLLHFSKLLEQCLALDPSHRLDPSKADKLAFFGGGSGGGGSKRVKVG